MSSACHNEEVEAATALAQIKGFASAYRIVFGNHALERMELRHVGTDDVREALLTATSCRPEGEPKWKVSGGHDLDGDELTVIVLLVRGVVVVTAY